MAIAVFCKVTPWSLVSDFKHFGETYHLHLLGASNDVSHKVLRIYLLVSLMVYLTTLSVA
jgi:hypothetical protein